MANKISEIIQPRSLQQRTLLFILLPTFLTLLIMGMVNVILVRSVLLNQWQQTAIARLERSALMIDSRLLRMKRLLSIFQGESGKEMNRQVSRFLMDRIRNSDGVVDVKFEWFGETQATLSGGRSNSDSARMAGRMMFHRVERLDVTTPQYDEELNGETVSLVSEFRDEKDETLGRVEVKISFYELIDNISETHENYELFLVDSSGNVLTRTALIGKRDVRESLGKFGGANDLESRTLDELQESEQGVVFGKGLLPSEISGFFRLSEAPWTVVVVAPGNLVFKPIRQFRFYYLLTGTIGLLFALWLIRRGLNNTTDSIRDVTVAAEALAAGKFGEPLEVKSLDEVGELTRNFNVMTSQLRERMQLQQAMGIAREIQQNLLPQTGFQDGPVSVSGASVYCDETGGDYYDLLEDLDGSGKMGVVVGDVVGHGVGAALLMTTVRALVRCRMTRPGEPSEAVTDVNRLLCLDTSRSGNFVTLFYLVIDLKERQLQWVRCGHDPAIVYQVETDEFSELHGKGFVLGVDDKWLYKQNSREMCSGLQVILIGSDGVWDAENSQGERFGRKRVQALIRENAAKTPARIIEIINHEIVCFRGDTAQNDDITLVVVKIGKCGPDE
ncbi:PP2C family protein-serine/threonine phosphatase [Desulfopila sp. IMCC35008]|uniref:PP2C family protein-serine/threonine phosphatase n=1 Tax=Desulfopila sp. IMCC35008 TaxID=2653858 RepID=UPI0013D18B4D|nr:SpoIIE family protein phosphatase [Desulfopila sp. IMCC35008]